MTAKRDYYDVLGIGRNADEKEIKRSYRKLAKKYHPDSNAGNAEAECKFKEITEAYNVLSDSEKKRLYDQFGHAAFDGTNPGNGTQGENMDDIFGDIFGDIFRGSKENAGYGGFQNSRFYNQEFRIKGQDVHAKVSVTFDEAAFGCDKVIHLQGPGGEVQSLQVHIPAGIDSGKNVRLKGKGGPGAGGGEAGDLFLKVTIGEKPGFERKGSDVYTTAEIPFTTAVFGGEARVKTLYGDIICKIPEGIQSGTKIRLKGKGIISMKNANVYGDQYVSIQIQVPKHLSERAKHKLKEYEEEIYPRKKQSVG